MVAVVLLVRHCFGTTTERPALQLVVEVVVGGAGYCVSALWLARSGSQDLLARVRDAMRARA
jgi:hypothetical protein